MPPHNRKKPNPKKYKQSSKLFLGALNQDLQKLSVQARTAFRQKLSKFVSDLCIGIYNNSPKMDEAPYASGQYAANTRLLVSKNDRNKDVSLMKQDSEYYALQDMNLQPGLSANAIKVQGYHRFLNWVQNNGIPDLIRIVNNTKNPDSGYYYQQNIETQGWEDKQGGLSTLPYEPFKKGLEYALRQTPDFATFVTINVDE